MKYIAVQGSNVPIRRCLIVKNDSVQFGCIAQFLTHLMYGVDKYLFRICSQANCRPLAKIFVLADNQEKTTGTAFPLPVLCAGGMGVQMFE